MHQTSFKHLNIRGNVNGFPLLLLKYTQLKYSSHIDTRLDTKYGFMAGSDGLNPVVHQCIFLFDKLQGSIVRKPVSSSRGVGLATCHVVLPTAESFSLFWRFLHSLEFNSDTDASHHIF